VEVAGEEAGWIDAVIIFGRLLRRTTPGDGGCGGEFEGERSLSAVLMEVLRGLPLRNEPRIVERGLRGGDSSRASIVIVTKRKSQINVRVCHLWSAMPQYATMSTIRQTIIISRAVHTYLQLITSLLTPRLTRSVHRYLCIVSFYCS
jgi:hypothetical protein